MVAKHDELSEQQERAIGLLLSGKNQRETANEIGVARETVCRWNGEAAFVATMNARRLETWKGTRDKLCALAARAAEVMEGLLDSEDEGVRLRAATAILKAATDSGRPNEPTEAEDVADSWERDAEVRRLLRLNRDDDRAAAEQRHQFQSIINGT